MKNIFDFINLFLHFGYVPEDLGNQKKFINSLNCRKDLIIKAEKLDNLIIQGSKTLFNVFEEETSKCQKKTHIVPLSGGMDSRAILAALLTFIDKKDIKTITFGSKRTWDYEIGAEIAKSAGVEHFSIDLANLEWKIDELVEKNAEIGEPTWLLDAYVNHKIPKYFGSDCVYWSGFMGETISGSHLPIKKIVNWDYAKKYFVSQNRYSRSIDLTHSSFDINKHLPERPFVQFEIISYYEQLDFAIRQNSVIRKIIMNKNYDYRIPFLNKKWIRFMLDSPTQFRQNQILYKKILINSFPYLFSLPVKNNYGRSLSAPKEFAFPLRAILKAKNTIEKFLPNINLFIDPRINYLDYKYEIRKNNFLFDVFNINLHDLSERKIIDWIDIKFLWQQHQNRRINIPEELILLVSLEIYLKSSGEII